LVTLLVNWICGYCSPFSLPSPCFGTALPLRATTETFGPPLVDKFGSEVSFPRLLVGGGALGGYSLLGYGPHDESCRSFFSLLRVFPHSFMNATPHLMNFLLDDDRLIIGHSVLPLPEFGALPKAFSFSFPRSLARGWAIGFLVVFTLRSAPSSPVLAELSDLIPGCPTQ